MRISLLLVLLVLSTTSSSTPLKQREKPYYSPPQTTLATRNETSPLNNTLDEASIIMDLSQQVLNEFRYIQKINHPFAWLFNIFQPLFFPSYTPHVQTLIQNAKRLDNAQNTQATQNTTSSSLATNSINLNTQTNASISKSFENNTILLLLPPNQAENITQSNIDKHSLPPPSQIPSLAPCQISSRSPCPAQTHPPHLSSQTKIYPVLS